MEDQLITCWCYVAISFRLVAHMVCCVEALPPASSCPSCCPVSAMKRWNSAKTIWLPVLHPHLVVVVVVVVEVFLSVEDLRVMKNRLSRLNVSCAWLMIPYIILQGAQSPALSRVLLRDGGVDDGGRSAPTCTCTLLLKIGQQDAYTASGSSSQTLEVKFRGNPQSFLRWTTRTYTS